MLSAWPPWPNGYIVCTLLVRLRASERGVFVWAGVHGLPYLGKTGAPQWDAVQEHRHPRAFLVHSSSAALTFG